MLLITDFKSSFNINAFQQSLQSYFIEFKENDIRNTEDSKSSNLIVLSALVLN